MKYFIRLLFLIILTFTSSMNVEASGYSNRRMFYHPSYSYLCENKYHDRTSCDKCKQFDSLPKEEQSKIKEKRHQFENRVLMIALFSVSSAFAALSLIIYNTKD